MRRAGFATTFYVSALCFDPQLKYSFLWWPGPYLGFLPSVPNQWLTTGLRALQCRWLHSERQHMRVDTGACSLCSLCLPQIFAALPQGHLAWKLQQNADVDIAPVFPWLEFSTKNVAEQERPVSMFLGDIAWAPAPADVSPGELWVRCRFATSKTEGPEMAQWVKPLFMKA